MILSISPSNLTPSSIVSHCHFCKVKFFFLSANILYSAVKLQFVRTQAKSGWQTTRTCATWDRTRMIFQRLCLHLMCWFETMWRSTVSKCKIQNVKWRFLVVSIWPNKCFRLPLSFCSLNCFFLVNSHFYVCFVIFICTKSDRWFYKYLFFIWYFWCREEITPTVKSILLTQSHMGHLF